MNGEKTTGCMRTALIFNKKLVILFVLSVSLISVAVTTIFMADYYSRIHYQILGNFCEEMIAEDPNCKQTVLEILKTEKSYEKASADENILMSFGYQKSDLLNVNASIFLIAGVGFAAGSAIFLLSFLYWHRRLAARIRMLTDYLEKINTGGQGLIFDASEDEFSRLQDEIYKTVTTLYQTRDAALEAKHNFADNLFNIAHQLKTPITAISLSNQMIREHSAARYTEQIKRQLSRLTYFEEALLLLSRIDAGTLTLKRAAVDVFTMLTLASDNLRELFVQAGVSIDIPEMGEMDIDVDLEWTMEAIMNLLKNCMEHSTEGAAVYCSYEENPLYVQIRIWDEGSGFAKEDLPHLFERFYRGKNSGNMGIGIGLSLAKAIIEMQDGMIRACNLPAGGACFEIRFYSH